MSKHDFYLNRKYPILILTMVMFFMIMGKLFYIQIIDQSYKLSATNNAIRKIVQYPQRGWIYDRNDTLLISNQISHDIMVVPYLIDNPIDTLLLCDIFNISKADFQKKIESAKKYSHYKPSVFLKSLTVEDFGNIQDKLHRAKGFYKQPRYIRSYHTSSGGHIFGYVGQITNSLLAKYPDYSRNDLIGITGLEKTYEKELRGEKGVKRMIVDVFGIPQGSLEDGKYDTIPKNGKEIQLTIDLALQEYGEKIMGNKRGSIVAIEPKTGEILCLISSPAYDPKMFLGNKRSANFRSLYLNPAKPLWDRSTSGLYPPGSIFKLINALIGLQENQIAPSTTFKCNNGWDYKDLHIACHKHKSPLNLREAIAQSCNAYFCSTFANIMSAKKSSSKSLNNWEMYTKSLGLNKLLHNDLHQEKSGFIPNSNYYDKQYGENRWSYSYIVSLGIGQDAILMTPIQMANLATLISNRGYYKTPHIVKAIDKSNKNINPHFSEKIYSNIDSIYFEYVIYGMETAIEGKDGTAQLAQIKGITLCGKTGTVQNSGDDHSVFIGFAPKKNPEIAIAVFVENGGWGGETAAPIASLCIEKYLTQEVNRKWLETEIIEKKIEYTK